MRQWRSMIWFGVKEFWIFQYHGDLKSNILTFIINLFSNRYFRACVESKWSDSLKNSVLQGIVLCVSGVANNSITANVQCLVSCSFFVDDFAIYLATWGINIYIYIIGYERVFQLVLNKLLSWSWLSGFNFSASKSQCLFLVTVSLACIIAILINLNNVPLGFSHFLWCFDSKSALLVIQDMYPKNPLIE